MKHNLPLPNFDKMTIKDPTYRTTYIRCLGVIHEHIDVKTLKLHALRYAKDNNIEPRMAFAALDDWAYTTVGKVVYLENLGFPITDKTKSWLISKMKTIAIDGQQAINDGKSVELSPIVEKSDKILSADELAAKIIDMVEADKLIKDREGPIKLLAIEQAKPKIIEEVINTLQETYDIYANTEHKTHKKIMDDGIKRSTMVRRRNEFGRVLQQVQTFAKSLKT